MCFYDFSLVCSILLYFFVACLCVVCCLLMGLVPELNEMMMMNNPHIVLFSKTYIVSSAFIA